MAQHTPGPWECGDPAKGDSALMVYCNDRTGQRIADCTNAFTFHSTAEKAANARLIAAAPDLLDYVRRCASNDHEANDLLKRVEGQP